MEQKEMNEQTNRKCPMRGFKDCLLRECAWYYVNECAIASTGYIDHTLRVMVEAIAPGKAEELFKRYAGGREESEDGIADTVPGADE